MQGDNPAIYVKPKSKTAWSEKLFAESYNANSKYWRLLHCNQDFHTFDFWLLDKEEIKKPRIVELKAHIGKKAEDRIFIGCDFIKIQKLRSLAIDTKAYIFHVFEDKTLIQDADTELDQFKEIIYSGNKVLLGLIRKDKVAAELPIGLSNLRSLQDQLQFGACLEKSLSPTVQETEAPVSQQHIPE